MVFEAIFPPLLGALVACFLSKGGIFGDPFMNLITMLYHHLVGCIFGTVSKFS